MKKVYINRYKITDDYSLGHCFVEDKNGKVTDIGVSLERGWQDNMSNISCVPEGTYPLKKEYSPRFNEDLWELYDVPGRSECKFHVANYWRQLNGCIALGKKHLDIDGDGDPDVTSSRKTLNYFHEIMGEDIKAEVIIKNI